MQDICNGLGRTLMGEVFERADAQSPTVEINGEQATFPPRIAFKASTMAEWWRRAESL